jgi:hypothetical protein
VLSAGGGTCNIKFVLEGRFTQGAKGTACVKKAV